MQEQLSIDEFKKAEIRIGEIRSAERVVDADRLLRLVVSFGGEERQVVSGISAYFPDPGELVGKRVAFVTNLIPRTIRGLESQAMILAAVGGDGAFGLLEPIAPAGGTAVTAGAKVN